MSPKRKKKTMNMIRGGRAPGRVPEPIGDTDKELQSLANQKILEALRFLEPYDPYKEGWEPKFDSTGKVIFKSKKQPLANKLNPHEMKRLLIGIEERKRKQKQKELKNINSVIDKIGKERMEKEKFSRSSIILREKRILEDKFDEFVIKNNTSSKRHKYCFQVLYRLYDYLISNKDKFYLGESQFNRYLKIIEKLLKYLEDQDRSEDPDCSVDFYKEIIFLSQEIKKAIQINELPSTPRRLPGRS